MVTKSISQLETAAQQSISDLFEMAIPDENSGTGYASKKVTMAQIADFIANDVEFDGLTTEAQNIIDAINEAAESGGTDVEANPAGDPTDTLEKIGIDGTIYVVGGGSVEPVSKTATGNPIHIEDAADAPIVSGEVSFEPQQDLHGYTKPWTGGSGKNLLPMTVDGIQNANTSGTWSGNTYTYNGITYTILTDNAGNVIGVRANGTASANSPFYLYRNSSIVAFSQNVINGLPEGSSYNTFGIFVMATDYHVYCFGYSNDTVIDTIPTGTNGSVYLQVVNGQTVNNIVFYPMIRLATETDPTFEPYSNICPIEGYTDCEVEVTDGTITKTYTIDLDGTRYGGTVDLVSGVMVVEWTHIASYAGETIGEPWLSDRDEYVAGTTPTTGAEVVYTLATHITVQLTPEQIRTLGGTNNISTNMTDMSLEYITQDYQPLVKLIERSAGASLFHK